MQIHDTISLGLLGIVLIISPISVMQSWSTLAINLKSPVEGCRSMFEQNIGLSWANQCNCDPEQGKFLCEDVDLSKLPPQYSFLAMGGLLLKFVFGFSIAGTLASIGFIIYKGRTPDNELDELNYKPYVTWMTSYTMILYLTALLIWSLFIKSTLDFRHGGETVYENSMGWTLCLVCLVLSSLSAILQMNQPSDSWDDDYGDYYEGDEGDDYLDSEEDVSDSDSGG